MFNIHDSCCQTSLHLKPPLLRKTIFRRLFGVFLFTLFLSGCNLDEKPDRNHVSVIPQEQTDEWALEWWLALHEQKLMEIQNNPDVDVVLLGDSITRLWELMGLSLWEDNPNDYTELNLGFSGDRTEQVLWRIENGQLDGINPKVLVLLIGTNNTGHREDPAVQTAYAIAKIVVEIRKKLPDTKILLMSLLPREELPGDPLRLINDDVNMYISLLDNDRDIFSYDISHLFLEDDGRLRMDLMGDGLHPSYEAFLLWRAEMAPFLEHLLTQ